MRILIILYLTINYDTFAFRYKFVCVTFIGEKEHQHIKMQSRCCWDSENDNYASYTLETPFYYCVSTVYACYYDWWISDQQTE